MSWLLNLLMLGKGGPIDRRSFTTLSTNATPGKPYKINAKNPAGVEPKGIFYYLKHIARIG